jgi:molecular chaperone GrpE (heat shock protein)
MLKKLWQLLFRPKPEPIADQKITNQSNGGTHPEGNRLLNLESEIQTLRLNIADRDLTISKLRIEGDRQRQNEESKQAIALQTQQEQLFTDLSTPIAQLLTQIHLLEVESKPIQAKDVLTIVKRILRLVEEYGLSASGTIGETVPFDPNIHQPLNSSVTIGNGQLVTIRIPAIAYQNKVLRAAGVEACLDV